MPVKRVGMASGTADLQRDLGGAIMQSIFGALLTAGYAAAPRAPPSPRRARTINDTSQAELTKSFAERGRHRAAVPEYADQITAAAKTAFLQGDQWAYIAGIVAMLLGAALVFFFFPRAEEEERLLAAYHAEDTGAAP